MIFEQRVDRRHGHLQSMMLFARQSGFRKRLLECVPYVAGVVEIGDEVIEARGVDGFGPFPNPRIVLKAHVRQQIESGDELLPANHAAPA